MEGFTQALGKLADGFLNEGGFLMENYFENMNTRVPSETILLLTHEFEKLSIH